MSAIQFCVNFLPLRETFGLVLTENQLAVFFDIETALVRGNESNTLNFISEMRTNLFRQTGGSRRVVSLNTIFNNNFHGFSPCSGPKAAVLYSEFASSATKNVMPYG